MDVTKALHALGTPYYICAGTLLRLHRDGQLSPNAGGDIDVWFPQDSIDPQVAVQLLEGLGFETNWAAPQNLHGYRDGGRFIDLEFPFKALRQTSSGNAEPHEVISWVVPRFNRSINQLLAMKRALEGESSPDNAAKRSVARVLHAFRRPIKPINTALLNFLQSGPRLKKVEYRIPSSFVECLEEVRLGGATWYQPRDVELVLESLYGQHWQTPRSGRVWFQYAKESP